MDKTGEQAPERSPAERRRSPRRRVLKNALIVFGSGYCTMGCQILDYSDTGAKLMPADLISCPSDFTLKPQVGPSRECEVAWRRNGVLGVRFL